LQSKVIAFYCVSVVAALIVFFPLLRRNKIAAFWFAVMVLAAIPAATVVPMSKNLGFVAVGAFGLIASFIGDLITRQSWLPEYLPYRILAWVACALLILVHVPGAVAGRVAAVKAVPLFFNRLSCLNDFGDWPKIGNENVIVINAPCWIALAYAPSYKAHHRQPLPKTMRTLVPCCTSFDVQRTDDKTLVIQSKAPDIFSCDNVGPIHGAYLLRTINLLYKPKCKKGDRYDLGGLTVEVLEVDASDLPSRVAFRFDWQTRSYQPYQPFKVPAIGQSVTLSGPPKVR
jgi:hypothetical protein